MKMKIQQVATGFSIIVTTIFATFNGSHAATLKSENFNYQTITKPVSVVGPITKPVAATLATFEPNNDDWVSGQVQNHFFPQEINLNSPDPYRHAFHINEIKPLDLVFQVIPSGGTTEYIAHLFVKNLTQKNWTGYRFELGFGTGENFIKSSLTDLLDFDSPTVQGQELPGAFIPEGAGPIFSMGNITNSSKRLDTIDHRSNSLQFFEGLITPDELLGFSFNIDIPDGLPNNQFTLRQIPIAESQSIPENSSALSFLIFGALGTGLLLKRKPNNLTLEKKICKTV
jgi:hypothetical protein